VTRILGIDYGTKRIGLAISDDLGISARPLEVVARSHVAEALRRIIDDYDIDRVIVGLPTGLGGKEGISAEAARDLGSEVEKRFGLTVEYVDERFTSRMAETALLESGMKRRARKERVDMVAAAIILQTYLDAAAGNSPEDDDVEPAGNQ